LLIGLIGGTLAAVLAATAATQQPPAPAPQQTQGQAQGQGRGGRGRGTPAEPGNCPPGTTEIRRGRCQAPEFPPPSIIDYKPKSTLVTKETPVPKAKFPVVDIHSHTGPTPDTIERLIQEMDATGLRVLNNLSGGADPAAIKQKVDYIRGSKYPDRFTVFANVNFRSG
jgi:hypothetical protein